MVSHPATTNNSFYQYQGSLLPDHEVVWDINLRTNLRLWPQPTPNIRALTRCAGCLYDEEAFLERFSDVEDSEEPTEDQSKTPRDTRSVRNTMEVLASAGLAIRDRSDVLVLTPLGQQVLSFLGLHGERKFANEHNIELAAQPMIRGLSGLAEVRAIWMLVRMSENRLSNEELNRSMKAIGQLSDVGAVAAKVLTARRQGNPSLIGDRLYEQSKYGAADETDQRKAMNPHFLLAGGGGIFLSVSHAQRELAEWAIPSIDSALQRELPLLNTSAAMVTTDTVRARQISAYAAVPHDVRGIA